MNQPTRSAAEPWVHCSSVDVTLGLLLDPVVADRRGCVDRARDVVLGDPEMKVSPFWSLTVDAAWTQTPAKQSACSSIRTDALVGPVVAALVLRQRAEQVLHVVAVLVGDDVRLGEVAARRAELALQHVVEERRVEVDPLVVRAVERALAGGRLAAAAAACAG